MSRERRTDAGRLQAVVAAMMGKAGLPAEAAAAVAEVLVRSELRGKISHGLRLLPPQLARLGDGTIPPAAAFEVISETGTTVLVDAHGGHGFASAHRGAQVAIAKAADAGMAAVVVRNATHFGPAGHYALMCAEAGCIGLVLANTPPLMAAPGVPRRVIGNGPLAFGVPSRPAPVVFDAAMSTAAAQRIVMAAAGDGVIPEGWLTSPALRRWPPSRRAQRSSRLCSMLAATVTTVWCVCLALGPPSWKRSRGDPGWFWPPKPGPLSKLWPGTTT